MLAYYSFLHHLQSNDIKALTQNLSVLIFATNPRFHNAVCQCHIRPFYFYLVLRLENRAKVMHTELTPDKVYHNTYEN